MRKFKIVAWLSAALLAACGGGNTLTGTKTGGPAGGPTVATVTLTSSAPSIAADGSDSATITAVAKDGNNNLVKGATVAFSSSAGGLAITQATTDVNGVATASLNSGGSAAGTVISVTASTGGVSSSVSVNVVSTQQTISVITSSPQIASDGSQSATITALVRGANNQFLSGVKVAFQATSGGLTVVSDTTDANGAATATLTAAGDPTNRKITVTATAGSATATVGVDVTGTRLTVVGPSSLVLGSQGTYTVSLLNAGNVGIANQVVALTSSIGNTLSPPTVTTGSTGQATFVVTATTSGNDSIQATALGLQSTQALVVSGQNFTFSAPASGAKINLSAVQIVSVTWTSGGTPQAGQTINFSTTRGTLSAGSAVTNSAGVATVTVSSTISGPAIISASATGVTAQVPVSFIATTPATVAVQASPSTIPTQGQSTISAVVRDAANNLVEGQSVDFQTVNDITGGTLTVATSVTDSEGRAQTVYQASGTQSASNGVTVRATVRGTAINATTTLTVGGQTVFLSLGTGNIIKENAPLFTQFKVPYSVQALDSVGAALKNQKISLTIHSAAPSPLIAYWKGFWSNAGGAWKQVGNGPGSTVVPCPNEDANLNAVLDTALGEDVSGNGNKNGILDPGDVAAVAPGSVTTDDTGTASFEVIYPEDHALWVQVKLTATATVGGTETTTSTVFVLPMLAEKLKDVAVTPPGYVSPYGVAGVCTDPN